MPPGIVIPHAAKNSLRGHRDQEPLGDLLAQELSLLIMVCFRIYPGLIVIALHKDRRRVRALPVQ